MGNLVCAACDAADDLISTRNEHGHVTLCCSCASQPCVVCGISIPPADDRARLVNVEFGFRDAEGKQQTAVCRRRVHSGLDERHRVFHANPARFLREIREASERRKAEQAQARLAALQASQPITPRGRRPRAVSHEEVQL